MPRKTPKKGPKKLISFDRDAWNAVEECLKIGEGADETKCVNLLITRGIRFGPYVEDYIRRSESSTGKTRIQIIESAVIDMAKREESEKTSGPVAIDDSVIRSAERKMERDFPKKENKGSAQV